MEIIKTPSQKVLEIIKSPRFMLLTATAIFQIIDMFIMPGTPMSAVLDVVKAWLLAVFGAGQLDSIATKLSSKK